MQAFSAAIDAIFADPNMAADATYRPCDGGADVPCRVIQRMPDEMSEFAGAQIVSGTLRVDVRASDVADPKEGSSFIIGGTEVVISGAPMRDRLGLVWRCGTIPAEEARA